MKKILIYLLSLSCLIFLTPKTIYAQTTAFKFVAWGDTKSDRAVLSQLSSQVKALNPSFTIYAGDLENDGFTQSGMDAWKNAVNGGTNNGIFNITFPVRGNHDDHLSGSSSNWQNYFNLKSQVSTTGGINYSALSDDLTYSYDYGNSRFIGIDVPGSVTLMTSAQIAWLDQRLTDAESIGLTHAFIYWHGPIYAADGHCCPIAPSSLISVLNKHPIVSATFHGHEHILTYTHMGSNRYSSITHPFEEFISGDAGAGPNTSTSGRYDYWLNLNGANTGGFVLISVNGNSYTASYYKGGSSTPQWTKTFSKNGTPTVTQSPTNTPTPKPTSTSTPTPVPSVTPTPSSKLPGDVDGDGDVDLFDFQLLSNSFNKSVGDTGYDARCNFNGDNIVDIFDFQILSNNYGKTGVVGATASPTTKPSNTPTLMITPTSGPSPSSTSTSGIPCGSLSGIERRFPCSPLIAGPMPESTTSGVDSWDMFSSINYQGVSNGINERFSAVANPAGSGVVVRNQNLLSDTEQHTTVGTGRNLPLGSTECSAFRWLWKNASEFPQKGWTLVWQLQMSGSPIVAIQTDPSNHSWFFRSRNGSDSGLAIPLGGILYGHWTYFVVCTHLAEAPDGWTKIWYRNDTWPDVNTQPFYQRSGHDTYQGQTGHNTIGIYAQHDGSSTSYYGYFDRYGRATTPQRAVAIAGNP